ncbi:MAG: hypothetical protein AAF585_08725 [Verrucomicrobiota bacterium]
MKSIQTTTPAVRNMTFYEDSDRVAKVTRNGVFGLMPCIELALVDSDDDARCFHLWEATPLEYLECLHL